MGVQALSTAPLDEQDPSHQKSSVTPEKQVTPEKYGTTQDNCCEARDMEGEVKRAFCGFDANSCAERYDRDLSSIRCCNIEVLPREGQILVSPTRRKEAESSRFLKEPGKRKQDRTEAKTGKAEDMFESREAPVMRAGRTEATRRSCRGRRPGAVRRIFQDTQAYIDASVFAEITQAYNIVR